jgi:hypothetical protein
MSNTRSEQANRLQEPQSRELQYGTPWVEYFMGVCLWALVVYGWCRAVSFSTSADIVNSVWFTVCTIAVNSALVALLIWSRVKSVGSPCSRTDLTLVPSAMQDVVN